MAFLFRKHRKKEASSSIDAALENVKKAAKGVKKAYLDISAMKEAYQEQATMLAEMCHASGGMVWKKDSEGRFCFASQRLCEDFFRTNCADVLGKTDLELIEEFKQNYPGKTHTYGSLCVSTDKFTLKKNKKCVFIEMGMIGEDPFVLHVIKTPTPDGGTIGFSFNVSDSCVDINAMVTNYLKRGTAEQLQPGVYYLQNENQHCNYLDLGYPTVSTLDGDSHV